jgi:hypothetical protein
LSPFLGKEFQNHNIDPRFKDELDSDDVENMRWATFAAFNRAVDNETVMTGKDNIVQVSMMLLCMSYGVVVQVKWCCAGQHDVVVQVIWCCCAGHMMLLLCRSYDVVVQAI